MARYTDPVCRLCRREGAKLFLKGTRCYSKKCSFERRQAPPGQHGVRRRKVGDYGMQLREKQKIRRVYSVLERQFQGYFEDGQLHAGRHRREPAADARASLRQRRLPHGFRGVASGGAPDGGPRPLRRERPRLQHSVDAAASRATRSRSARRIAPVSLSRRPLRSSSRARSRSGSASTGRSSPAPS